MYKDIFGKVDLFAPLLGDIEAIILCSFDFDLKKKKLPARPFSKKVVEDNQTIIFLGLMFSDESYTITEKRYCVLIKLD